MSAPVIEIRNLTKVYRRGLRRAALHAVRDLNITVQPATAVAFVGPNGAGKTTTILSLLGLLKPNNGTIEVFGTPLDTPSLRRIGYQPEIFHTYPFYTATQALHYYGRLSGLTTASLNPAPAKTAGAATSGRWSRMPASSAPFCATCIAATIGK